MKSIAEISVLKFEKKGRKKNICRFAIELRSVKYRIMDEIVEAIRARISTVDRNSPRKLKGIFQLNVKKDDGTTRPITLDLNKLEVLDENVHEEPDVSVDFDANTLGQVTKNELSFCDAVKIGKIAISGNQELAKTLGNVVNSKPIQP